MNENTAAVDEQRISVMLDRETREAIQRLADLNDRTFSAEVRRALREWTHERLDKS